MAFTHSYLAKRDQDHGSILRGGRLRMRVQSKRSSGNVAEDKSNLSRDKERDLSFYLSKFSLELRMLFTENYLQYVKEVSSPSLMDYEVISIDDLALIPRKTSVSETSSNGIGSYDSGHESYLDDGTGYSGDDEESLQCELCLSSQEKDDRMKKNGKEERKRHRRSRKSRNKKKTKKKDKKAVVLRELPKNDNFEFEGEKKVEMKWTLECFTDMSLIPKLKRVIIDRGRPEDLGVDNLLIFDESSAYSKMQNWRQGMIGRLEERNNKQVKAFDLLPSYLSCDSCIEQRQKEIKEAVSQGRTLNASGKLPNSKVSQDHKLSNSDESKAAWRKKIVNDLKLTNCRVQACIRAVKRERIVTTSYRFGHHKRRTGILEKVEEEDWEVYEIISDDEFWDTNDFL